MTRKLFSCETTTGAVAEKLGKSKPKERFDTLENALEKIERCYKSYDPPFSAYKCPSCSFFHIGRTPKRILENLA